jgi:RNA polymerase sigma-70 factor, ECF subfamily
VRSDADLLKAWRGGVAEAGEALFDRYYDSVYRFFCNKVPEAIGDLVQQTFMACIEGRDRLREEGSFRAYLFAVAHNVLRGHLRAKYRSRAVDLDEESACDLAPGPATIVGRKREERLLLEALRRIPLEQQVLLELHYWERLKGHEIGAILDLPENTVRSRLVRAHERLKGVMAKLAATSAELQSTLADLDQWARQCQEQLVQR